MTETPTTHCVRCEKPIPADEPRYFRSTVVAGVRRIEYFDESCFKRYNPVAAEILK